MLAGCFPKPMVYACSRRTYLKFLLQLYLTNVELFISKPFFKTFSSTASRISSKR